MSEQFPDGNNGLYLKGELQIDTAIDALREHAIGSQVLNLLTDLRAAHNFLKDTNDHMQPDVKPALYVDHAGMKQDLVNSLRKRLGQEDLNDFERSGVEELLAIQENQQPE